MFNIYFVITLNYFFSIF